ncbi:hypothetical protein A0256_19640 [Mucilaginibacter sp. PAMC 26640]|nr:hypothetical protein A0256_19640 [Mucilaginibacter sp. PAMC 26640]
MADTITNLEGVKAWLQPVKPGDVVGVSSAMFDAPMVNELLDMLPDTTNIEVTVTAVAPDGDSPSLTGVATVLGQPLTNTIFTFTQPADVLLLDLNLNIPEEVTWQLIDIFNIGFTKLKGTMTPDAEQSVITLGFACDVVAGSPKQVHLPVEMAIPTFDGDWTLSGSFDQIGDLSYDILDALAGNNNITSILPDQIRVQINKFSIKEFQLSFNPSNQTCAFIRIVLKYDADWHFFGNLFVVENIEFEYEIYNPFTSENYYQATLLANMNLFEGFPFQVGGQFPDKVVFAQLQPDRPAELTKVFNFLKLPLPGGFPDIEISTLSLVYYTADGGYDFKLSINKPIPIAGKVSLDSASFDMGANYDDGTDKLIGFGSLYAKFTIDETVVLLSAVYKEGEGVDMTGEVDNLPIGQLIKELLLTFQITDYPKFIEGITLTKLKVTYNTSSGDFTFLCIGHIPMANNPGVDIEVSLKALKSGDGYDNDIEAMGKVTYNLQEYTLLFTKTSTETAFSAQWLNKGTPLGINDIADMLGIGNEVPEIPSDLDLGLKAAAFVYDKAEKQPLFVLEAASANYGSAAFAAIKDLKTQKWIFYFGMATDAVIDLSNLPIIDKITFISEGILAVQAIHADISSGPISKDSATTINDCINKYAPGGIIFPNVPAAGMINSVAFSMQVNIGGTIIPISLGADQGTQLFLQSQRNMLQIDDRYESLYPIVQTTNSDNGGSKTFWFNLEKNFGPLYFEKIGLAYKDSKIWVLVNVAATAGGLTIALDGFGVSLPIKDFDVSFTISGISLTFQSGPILISGGLMGSFSPVNLVGQVYIKNKVLTIGALAGYTVVDDHPSLFVYAVLNYPIGGPPYFFVTGLAAGFGFNRSLVIPGINGVANFPFVQWAMGLNNPPSSIAGNDIAKQINQVLTTIVDDGIVAPAAGSNWLAAGIRFTSFEILDSFALLTIAFGNNFEIALLGLSRLILPPGAGIQGSPLPVIVYAELALIASFSTETGLIAVQGQLTNSSYVLSKNCHLTGGFAFYIWVSGDHLGEFVVTMGGYNPNYQPPSYYPVVPRLGMNWRVTSNLTIKGGEYFALTSNAVMAGGYMDAVWQSGGIKAWFSVQADFLIMWRPFYYDIRAGVSIGASFTIDLWFTTVSMTIHVGATLHIWGPEFSGIATVDLSIISFTISFGAKGQIKNKTITWNEFAKDMLPQKNATAKKLRSMHAEDAGKEPDPDVCKIVISNGLITELSNVPGELNWIVSGEKFELTTQSAIPSKDFELLGLVQADEDDENYAVAQNTDFGIRPTGTATSALTSKQVLTITSSENSSFRASKTLGKVAKGLWQPVPFDSNGNPILGNPVKDTTIDGVLTGFSVLPYVAPPKHTLPVTLANLQYTLAPEFQYFIWSDTYVATEDDFASDTVQSTIMSKRAVDNRDLLLQAILANGPGINPNVNVALLADPATNYLLAQPLMRLLGEEK